ncbi:MAG: hypothetical protein R3D60_13165 [Paracoccaceae bacterium]
MPRAVDPVVQAYRDSGRALVERHLVWVVARLAATGAPVSGGFWDGRDDAQIPVFDPTSGTSVTRPYQASGSLIEIEAITHVSGVDIHPVQVTLSPVTEAVDQQLRAYDLRGASVELHRLWLDYDTREILAPAHVWLTGTLNKAPATTPAAGGTARLTYSVVPQTRALTSGNPEPISDTVQSRRSGDRFLRHVGVAGVREIPWMRARVTGGSQ